MVVSLRGHVSVFFVLSLLCLWLSSGFSPLGVDPGFCFESFSRSLFHFPFWWGTSFRPRSLRRRLPPLQSLSLMSSAVSGLGLSSVFPSRMVSVPTLLLILSVHAALFLASVFSSLRPLHPEFQFFLVCVLAGSSSRLLPRSDLSFLRDGVALWNESVDSVGSFAFFSWSFSRTLYTTGWFCCRSLPLFSTSSFLDFCEFFFPSSHMCCVLECGLSWVCAAWFVVLLFGILAPPLSVLLFSSLHTVQFL